MADEGLHEIQLKGKQLVFLFMASTVLAVVIFLCGVMVGRGVPGQRFSQPVEAATNPDIDPTVQPSTVTRDLKSPAPAPGGASGSNASADGLSYPEILTDAPEIVKEPVSAAAVHAAAATAAAPAKTTEPAVRETRVKETRVKEPAAKVPVAKATAASAPLPPAASEPAGNGYVVQVAAVNERREADAIARRLSAKGYPSFVVAPRAGAPRMFRVRVGKYKERRAAESVARRLAQQEQFKPWITR